MSQSDLSREQLEALVGCKIKVKPNGTKRTKKGGLTVATLKRIDGNRAYFVPSGHRREEVCHVEDIVYWPKGMHFNQALFERGKKLFSPTLKTLIGAEEENPKDNVDDLVQELADKARKASLVKSPPVAPTLPVVAELPPSPEQKSSPIKPSTEVVATTSAEALVVCSSDNHIFWNSEGYFVKDRSKATLFLTTRGANVARSLIGKNYKNGSDRRKKWGHILDCYTLVTRPFVETKNVPCGLSESELTDQYYTYHPTEIVEPPKAPEQITPVESTPAEPEAIVSISSTLVETPVIPPCEEPPVKTTKQLLQDKLDAVISARNSVLTAEIMLHEEQIKLRQAEAEYDILIQQNKMENIK